MTPDIPPQRHVKRRVVLTRPHRMVYASEAEQRAVWAPRRRLFLGVAIAFFVLTVVMFSTHQPFAAALAALASVLAVAVVIKARRYTGKDR
jgi:hypothetical protein